MTVSPKLGVVIVTYNASEVIRPCLESLLTAPGAGGLAIVVVDNASPDGTADLIERWARGEAEQAPDPASPVPLRAAPKPLPLAIRAPGEVVEGSLTLIRSGLNRGFAYGVNRGLEALKSRDDVAAFWVLTRLRRSSRNAGPAARFRVQRALRVSRGPLPFLPAARHRSDRRRQGLSVDGRLPRDSCGLPRGRNAAAG